MLDQPNPYQRELLYALNGTGRHIYGGTVPRKVVAQRRAKNKTARRSRRANR